MLDCSHRFGVFIVSNQGGAKTQLKGLRVKFEQILTQVRSLVLTEPVEVV